MFVVLTAIGVVLYNTCAFSDVKSILVLKFSSYVRYCCGL